MKGYVLTDKDIRILVGAAGNAVCEDRVVPPSMDMLVMEISAEIADRIIEHLSGRKMLSEDAIGTLESMMRIFEGGVNNNAECQAQKD